MTILNRLRMELSNREYLSEDEYRLLLAENGLNNANDTYDKATMQKQLLITVLNIMEIVANDIDIMRKVTTEFTTTSDAYKFLNQRIQQIKDRIASIPDVEEEYSAFSLMYTRD